MACLWALLARLAEANGGEAWLVGACLAAGSGEAALLRLLLEGGAHLLPVLEERELHEARHPFSPPQLDRLACFVNRVAFELLWREPSLQRAHPALGPAATKLLALLVERDARRPFRATPSGRSVWLLPVEVLQTASLHGCSREQVGLAAARRGRRARVGVLR